MSAQGEKAHRIQREYELPVTIQQGEPIGVLYWIEDVHTPYLSRGRLGAS